MLNKGTPKTFNKVKGRSLPLRKAQFNTVRFFLQPTFKQHTSNGVILFDIRVVVIEWFAFWHALVNYSQGKVKKLKNLWESLLSNKGKYPLALKKRIMALSLLLFSVFPASQIIFADRQFNTLTTIASNQNVGTTTAKVKIVSQEAPIFQIPVTRDFYISQYFSRFHPGIDIVKAYGEPIRPAAKGVVERVDWELGYGKTIIVKHNDRFSSRYAHLSETNVKVGQGVDENTILGKIGTTGWSTGPHLHFEMYDQGKTINPLGLLPSF